MMRRIRTHRSDGRVSRPLMMSTIVLTEGNSDSTGHRPANVNQLRPACPRSLVLNSRDGRFNEPELVPCHRHAEPVSRLTRGHYRLDFILRKMLQMGSRKPVGLEKYETMTGGGQITMSRVIIAQSRRVWLFRGTCAEWCLLAVSRDSQPAGRCAAGATVHGRCAWQAGCSKTITVRQTPPRCSQIAHNFTFCDESCSSTAIDITRVQPPTAQLIIHLLGSAVALMQQDFATGSMLVATTQP